MRRVSDGEETVVLVPPVLEPVEVEVPLVGVAPEIRDVAVAIQMPPDRLYKIPSIPPPFECSRGCIVFGALKPAGILYQVASFFKN